MIAACGVDRDRRRIRVEYVWLCTKDSYRIWIEQAAFVRMGDGRRRRLKAEQSLSGIKCIRTSRSVAVLLCFAADVQLQLTAVRTFTTGFSAKRKG